MANEIGVALIGSASALAGALVTGVLAYANSRAERDTTLTLARDERHASDEVKLRGEREELYLAFMRDLNVIHTLFIGFANATRAERTADEYQVVGSRLQSLMEKRMHLRLVATGDVDKAVDRVLSAFADHWKTSQNDNANLSSLSRLMTETIDTMRVELRPDLKRT